MGNPYILVEDFRAGLDTRKMTVTSPPGTLQTLTNGQITRGGEIEKSQSFSKIVDMVAGDTHGLLSTPNGFLVFGSEDLSATYTNNVISSNPPIRYQRLTVSSGAEMEEVLSATLYSGVPYVIAKYDDGVIHHFYDGTEVTDWFSNKGRAQFTITGGSGDAATAATGSFDLAEGFTGDTITNVSVDGSNILSSTLTFQAGDTTESFISDIVDNINGYTATSGYTASWSGDTITITAVATGTGPNSDVVAVTTTGNLTASNISNMSGGTDASQITALTVNAASVIDTAIDWSGSNSQTATAVAAAVNNYTGTSGYSAVANGSTVTLIHEAGGTSVNTHAVAITTTGSITITPASGITIENGSATAAVYEPGRYAKTVDTKMYVLSGSVMHYSGVASPTDFDSGTGNGFDNLSTNTAGSEQLVAMANYFQNVAIFSRNNVHIWAVDADPAQNLEVQVLNNTGAIAPKSVIEFGDNDVFYLSESGIRSLRARDSSNAAFVNDVGVAIDTLVQDIIRTNEIAGQQAAGVLEPRDSRYMLSIDDDVFVFSFFPTSKVSAWSQYSPGFAITDWAFSGQIILCRAGDSVYRFGGQQAAVYDATAMTIVLPFLDSGDPAANKTWTALDIACEGVFDVFAAFDPLNPDTFEKMATVENTSYHSMRIPLRGRSSHISLKFVSKNDGYARLGNAAIHYREGSSS